MPDATKLIEAGPLGVLVFVVLVFVWYLDRKDRQNSEREERRDKSWQDFYREQRQADTQAIAQLVEQVRGLAQELVMFRSDFEEHNTWERTKLEAMTRQPRRPN